MIGRKTILSVKIGNNAIVKHFYLIADKDIINSPASGAWGC